MKLKDNSTQEIDTALYQLEQKLKSNIRLTDVENSNASTAKINAVDKKLTEEVKDRQSADEKLQDNINKEITDRQEADAAIENAKQDKLIAGDNIQIDGNVISAISKEYTAEAPLKVTDGKISLDTVPVNKGGTGVTTQADINKAFIGGLTEGTDDVTDGTMFVSSCASDNGFADTTNTNVPYKRKFLSVWNYIKGKISSVLGLTKDNYGGKAATAGNADTVDTYHASDLWRSDGAIWNPKANITMTPSGNGDEWSFDFRNKNGKTGSYWQVWDENKQTLLRVNADDGKVSAPYGFVGNLSGKADTAGTADKTVNDIAIDIPYVSESGQYVIPFGNIPEPTSTEVNSPYNWDITGFFSIIRPAGHNGSHLWFEAGHGFSHDWTTYAYLDKLDFNFVTTSIKAFQYEGKWWLGLCINTSNQGYSGKMTITYRRGLPATPTCILYNSRSDGVANEEIYNSIQDIPSSWWKPRTIYNPTTFTQNITAPSIKATTNFIGNLTGNSATATTADNAKNMYLQTLDLTSLDKTKFYPMFCISPNEFAEVAIYSPSLGGSAEYNQNRIHFDISTYGWSDEPFTLNIREYACYDNKEITIGCIGRGVHNGAWAIWLRGGRTYSCFTKNCNLSLKTSDYTYGTETYTVGTNYYGGANINVEVVFTPQSTITDGSYSNRPIKAPSIKITNNLTLNSANDITLSSFGNEPLSIGTSSSTNLGIDTNEIQVRNNGKAATLYLNNNGGNVEVGGGDVSGAKLVIHGKTVNSNSYTDTNPKLEFWNNNGSQNISLTFTDFDAVQAPASLTLNGNQGNEYFIAPNIKATTNFIGNLKGNVTGNVSGSSGSASKLTTARTAYVDLGNANTNTTVDWSGTTTIPVNGVLGVANGGTGASTAEDAANSLIGSLASSQNVPVDSDYFISQVVNGGPFVPAYQRRPVSKLWEYIKGKILQEGEDFGYNHIVYDDASLLEWANCTDGSMKKVLVKSGTYNMTKGVNLTNAGTGYVFAENGALINSKVPIAFTASSGKTVIHNLKVVCGPSSDNTCAFSANDIENLILYDCEAGYATNTITVNRNLFSKCTCYNCHYNFTYSSSNSSMSIKVFYQCYCYNCICKQTIAANSSSAVSFADRSYFYMECVCISCDAELTILRNIKAANPTFSCYYNCWDRCVGCLSKIDVNSKALTVYSTLYGFLWCQHMSSCKETHTVGYSNIKGIVQCIYISSTSAVSGESNTNVGNSCDI